MTTSSDPRQRYHGGGDDSDSYFSGEPFRYFQVMITLSSHESQDEEDLLGAVRSYRFKLSDSGSVAERSPTALEADKKEDRPPDSLPPP